MKKFICFFKRLEEIMSKPGDEPFFNLKVASRISLYVMSSNLLKGMLLGIDVLFDRWETGTLFSSILFFNCVTFSCMTKSDATFIK